MRQLSTLVVVGMFVVPLAGCNSGNQESDASTPSTPPEVEAQPAAKPFTQPAVVNQPVKIAIASPGLIQPTNSNQRVKQVAKGRQDPFAGLFAQVNYTVPTGTQLQASARGDSTDTPQRTIQGLRRLSRDSGAQSVAAVGSRRSSSNRSGTSRPNIAQSRSGSGSSRRPNNVVIARGSGSSRPSPGANRTSSNPPKPPNSDQIATGTQTNPNQTPLPPVGAEFPGALPPPPQQPDLAQKVAVSGVVQIGEQVQAIVRVPNEGASRYVGVGQRLSNGEVLVKRIEMNQGAEPIVILEQYGVEVAKAIGETAQSQETADTPDDSSAPESNPVDTPEGSSGSSAPETPNAVPSPTPNSTPATPGGLAPTTPPTSSPTPATPGGLVPTTSPTATPPPPPDGSDNISPDSSETSP